MLVTNIFKQALDRLAPATLVADAIRVVENRLTVGRQEFSLGRDSGGISGVWLLAAGKASQEMATAAAGALGDHLREGLVITPYEIGQLGPGVRGLRASHPVPDQRSLKAGEAAVAFVGQIPSDGLLIHCLSGGTSSLLTLPAEGISMEALNRTYELLNNSGATIREINTVRKHLSGIKGGQLLRRADASVALVDLVISDVPDDDLAIIGSGPTTPDVSTYREACQILLEYGLWERVPDAVRTHLEKGVEGAVPETVKPGDDPLQKHDQYVIGSAGKLAQVAASLLKREGYEVHVADRAYNEEAGEVAERIASEALDLAVRSRQAPAALICYGESRVEVTGEGKGGRNQELALRAALAIEGRKKITWLSAGTDGIDGPTDAAGAVVDGDTILRAREQGLDPANYLHNNDSYHFHEAMGTLLVTGPTGNNLMDLQIVLVE